MLQPAPSRLDESSSLPGGVDLRDLFRLVRSNLRFVAAAGLIAGLLALGAGFLMPKWYRATTVILPPEESDLLGNMALAQRALTRFPAFGILSDYFTPADVYKAILQSRTVHEEVIRAHDLDSVYKQKSMEKTVRELRGHYRVRLNPDGTISLSFDDRDRERAAAVANTFIVLLDRFNVEKRNYQARRTRVFLENRVREVDSLLRVSETELRKYQELHHTVATPGVSSGDVQAAADLMARKILLEVRIGVLRSYLREDNDQVVQARTELESLKRRIGSLPALQNELLRLIRDLKIQEQLYLLLTSELEQARIRETMDTPTVEVLDAAVPPERHVRPKKAFLAVGAALAAAMACGVWLVLRSRARVPSTA